MAWRPDTSDSTEPEMKTQERERLLGSSREEEIRRRAHEIYLARGGEPGHDVEDWLQAERELTMDQSKAAGE